MLHDPIAVCQCQHILPIFIGKALGDCGRICGQKAGNRMMLLQKGDDILVGHAGAFIGIIAPKMKLINRL